MIGFSKSLAQEYATKGITANNVPPGFVDTDHTLSVNGGRYSN